jgi:hypothetical protein
MMFGRLPGMRAILILLTGYHSQVDTFAILFALASWMLIEPALRASNQLSAIRLIGSALLLGLR